MEEALRIDIPERGEVLISKSAWQALSAHREFWRLENDQVVKFEAISGGRYRLRGGPYVGKALIGQSLVSCVEKVPGALVALSELAGLGRPKLVNASSPYEPDSSSARLLISEFVAAAKKYVSRHKAFTYATSREVGSLVGGRINVSDTAKLRARGIAHQVAFSRSIVSGDLPLNQCVYAALSCVEKVADLLGVEAHVVSSARTLKLVLADCRSSAVRSTTAEMAAEATQIGSTRSQPAAVSDVALLAAAVLDATGFGGERHWEKSVPRSWFVNLETMFEAAVRQTVGVILDDKRVTGPKNRPPLFEDHPLRYRANPDVLVHSSTDEVDAIIDAKYKELGGWPSTDDVHELIAHAAAYRAKLAALIYPCATGFQIIRLGNSATGCTVFVVTVPLSSFRESLQQTLTTMGLVAGESMIAA